MSTAISPPQQAQLGKPTTQTLTVHFPTENTKGNVPHEDNILSSQFAHLAGGGIVTRQPEGDAKAR